MRKVAFLIGSDGTIGWPGRSSQAVLSDLMQICQDDSERWIWPVKRTALCRKEEVEAFFQEEQ